MNASKTKERRGLPLHRLETAHGKAARWLAASLGAVALLLAAPAISHAEEANPNNYSCLGHIAQGKAEAASSEQQVQYSFYCNGPITGYQLQSQIQVTGIQSPPLATNALGAALPDSFSCSGEVPGYALNCVGLAKGGYETITGQFAIGSKLCTEPRVDPLLTVVYATVEKGVVTQAISGPFDLGRPSGCRPDALSGSTRLNPKTPGTHPSKKKHSHSHHKGAVKLKK
jgi:hypothetical protein